MLTVSFEDAETHPSREIDFMPSGTGEEGGISLVFCCFIFFFMLQIIEYLYGRYGGPVELESNGIGLHERVSVLFLFQANGVAYSNLCGHARAMLPRWRP
jgi:hypothetical protein